jgi:dihydroorotase
MTLLIRGGRVVDPASGLDAVRDVLIRDGRIAEIGESLPARDAEIVDASGAIVAPGFIDMHVHLREPGQTHKETIATGSAAAVLGGFTAVACMPNTEPALDTAARIAYVVELGRAANLARVYPIGAITQGRAGEVLAPYHAMHAAGAVAWSDDGTTVASARVLRDAALAALDVAGPMISHCEDADLKGDRRARCDDRGVHEESVSHRARLERTQRRADPIRAFDRGTRDVRGDAAPSAAER